MVIRAGRGGVGRSVRLAIVTAFLLTGIVGVTAPAVSAAAGCSETTKFVQELSANPGTLSAKYFGIRGATYTFDHTPNCGPVAQSFFIRASPDYSAWVETGTRTDAGDDAQHTHVWAEWRYYPVSDGLKTYDSVTGVLTTGTTYSFMLRNGTGNTFDGHNTAR